METDLAKVEGAAGEQRRALAAMDAREEGDALRSLASTPDDQEPRGALPPYSIVWTHLPPITWVLPFIGHMGITDSRGVVYDFVGGIGVGDLMCGPAIRTLTLKPSACSAMEWDEAVQAGNDFYSTRMHNICCDNCHSHVAVCLERMRYRKRGYWDMVQICFWVFFMGKYTSFYGFLKQWLVFCIIVAVWLSA